MTEQHDINMARDVGSLQADMRTVKHDVAQVSQKIDGISNQITAMNTQRARGLGFFAGAAFIVTTFGGLLLAAAKLLFGSHGS